MPHADAASDALDIDHLTRRADALLRADDALLAALKQRRADAGLSMGEVAERMGVPPAVVEDLEHYNADPRISILRRYAMAVGVTYEHDVRPDPSAANDPVIVTT